MNPPALSQSNHTPPSREESVMIIELSGGADLSLSSDPKSSPTEIKNTEPGMSVTIESSAPASPIVLPPIITAHIMEAANVIIDWITERSSIGSI